MHISTFCLVACTLEKQLHWLSANLSSRQICRNTPNVLSISPGLTDHVPLLIRNSLTSVHHCHEGRTQVCLGDTGKASTLRILAVEPSMASVTMCCCDILPNLEGSISSKISRGRSQVAVLCHYCIVSESITRDRTSGRSTSTSMSCA